MQPLYPVRALLCLGDDAQSSTVWINHRGAGDPNVVRDIAAFAYIGAGNCRDAGPQKTHLPERTAAQSVGIKGVNSIVLCRHIDHIVEALSRDVHVRNVEGRGKGET